MKKLDLSTLKLPSDEELEELSARRHAEAKAPFEIPGSKAFIGVSLKAWLDVMTAAGIPSIPAEAVTSFKRDTFRNFETSMLEEPEVWRNFHTAVASIPATHMARWDACSSLDLKFAMAEKVPFGEHARALHPGDPRAYEILSEYPADKFTVWSRPWVEAKVVDGYPVEFRVFVKDSQVLGIASYYPQRALPGTPDIISLAEQCGDLTSSMLRHLASTGQYPWMVNYARHFTEGTVNATLDFLVTLDNQVLFLEAGPPYGAGAHPCAFIDRSIEGIALALAPGVALR
ncbi:hypothetical protein G3A43_06930 [Paraburkholderia aspalathi]|nr:hypothetical protein [Paraburkholderia aspalathi]MBK3779985.1 hypothetical protein [Paraburkholderia aspalathi]